MKPPCLGSHFAVIETLALSSAVVSNATLAFLIVKKTSTELRTYSRVLLCNCVVDATFSAASFLFQVHGDMRHGMFVLVVNGVFVGDLQRNSVYLGGYMFALYAAILYAAVPMAFRYMAVCREYTVSRKEFTLLVLLVLFLASWPPAVHYHTWWPSSLATTRKYADIIDNSSCQDAGQMYISPLSEMLGANALRFVGMGAIFSSAYSVIVICAYKAATPLLLHVVPLGFGEAAIFGGCEFCEYTFPFISTFLAWIPAVNAFSTIFFIKCYRNALRTITGNTFGRASDRLGWKTASAPCARHTAVSPLPSINQS